MSRSTVCLSFDFDAMSVWLAYDEPTPAMLYRGEYGACRRSPDPRLARAPRHRGDILRPWPGGATPSQVLEIWEGEFDWMDEHVDGGILTVTMHPQVIGRGHRMAMLERFVRHCSEAGARFARMGDVAQELSS